MCRRRRKTLTFIIGALFMFFTIEIYQVQQSNEVDGSYMNGHFKPKDSSLENHQSMVDNVRINATIRKVHHVVKGSVGNAKNVLKDIKHQNLTSHQDAFAPRLSGKEKQIAYKLLSVLHKTMISSNLTYFIYSGTLLGSYRHHDLIPWDDDLDIFTDIGTKGELLSRLEKLAPEYTVFVAGNRLKFYVTNAVKTSQFPWTFPYIDISFYKDNGTNLYDYSDNQDMGDFMFVYKKSTVFPLHLRPLGELMVNAPKDTLANLRATYPNLKTCRSLHYLHRNENLTGKVEHKPCVELKKTVGFVHRKPADKGVEETLKIGEEVIQTILVDEPEYAITDPYTLELLEGTL